MNPDDRSGHPAFPVRSSGLGAGSTPGGLAFSILVLQLLLAVFMAFAIFYRGQITGPTTMVLLALVLLTAVLMGLSERMTSWRTIAIGTLLTIAVTAVIVLPAMHLGSLLGPQASVRLLQARWLIALLVAASLLLGGSIYRLYAFRIQGRGPRNIQHGMGVSVSGPAFPPADARDYKGEIQELTGQLSVARDELQRERARSEELHRVVESLRPRAERLQVLESWIWPRIIEQGGRSLEFVGALEAGCSNSSLRGVGCRIYARLHLLADSSDNEPDRCAGLLDHLGQDFYTWVESAGMSGALPQFEEEFLSLLSQAAGRCGFTVRRARPGDELNPRIHDATGGGMVVRRARSFHIKRNQDNEIVRRALVDA